jgi:DNA polymerase-3 subunit delta
VFYILHGEEEYGRSRELAGLRARLAEGDEAMAELNTAVLDGGRVTLGELRHACDTMPFMSDRRLVIVHGLLRRLVPSGRGKVDPTTQVPAREKAFVTGLAAYLPNLAPTARLVFVEDESLPGTHPILKVAKAEGKKNRAFVKLFARPKDKQLPSWIRQRARSKGGKLDGEAVEMLAGLAGSDLRLLDQEIDKLLMYAGERTVTAEDVLLLVSRAREASVFDLVDCVGRRETDRALRLLHRMLDEEQHPLYLLTMLARQVRILIQVSELQAQGLTQQAIAGRLKLHSFVVKKAMAQSQNFDMAQLEEAHRNLVEADWSIKTGQAEGVLALDMLVVALTRA